MTRAHTTHPTRALLLIITAFGALVAAAIFGVARGAPVQAAATTVPLGTAADFAVLAGSGITNTGPTAITGDMGTFPTTDITGAADITLKGSSTNHAGDAVTQDAKSDLVIAYNDAAAALPPTAVPEELGRIAPYTSGIYKASSSLQLTGAMTLDAGGDPSAVFIFQAPASTLTTASNSSVVLLNGAQACNIFWQVGSSATIGTGTAFRGNILAHTSITANTNATFEGRLLASNGAVTLHSNTITKPGCNTTTPTATTPTATTPTATTPTATSSASSGPTATPTDGGGLGGGSDNGSGTGGGSDNGSGTTGGASDNGSGTTGGGSGTNTTGSDTGLPGTGGPNLFLPAAGLLAVAGGVLLLTLRKRGGTRTHRRSPESV